MLVFYILATVHGTGIVRRYEREENVLAVQHASAEDEHHDNQDTEVHLEEAPKKKGTKDTVHELESEWVMWEHRARDKNSKSYENNMAQLAEFATVEDFWRLWNNIPKPSQIFYDGRTRKKFKEHRVESFSVFKKNIKPEWEDPMNRAGAEWFCSETFSMPQLDELWQDLVLGMVSETIDPTDEICGARVVDKSSNGRQMYRLELWIKKKDEGTAKELLEGMNSALGKGCSACKWEFRPH